MEGNIITFDQAIAATKSSKFLSSSRHTLYAFDSKVDEDYELPKRSLSHNQLIFAGPLRSGVQGPMLMNPIYTEDQSPSSITPQDSSSETSTEPDDQLIIPEEEEQGQEGDEEEETFEGDAPSSVNSNKSARLPRYLSVFTAPGGDSDHSGSNSKPTLASTTTSSGHSSASLSSSPTAPLTLVRRAQKEGSPSKRNSQPSVQIRSPYNFRRRIPSNKCLPPHSTCKAPCSKHEACSSSGRGSTTMSPASSDTSDSDKRRGVSFKAGTLDNEGRSRRIKKDRSSRKKARRISSAEQDTSPDSSRNVPSKDIDTSQKEPKGRSQKEMANTSDISTSTDRSKGKRSKDSHGNHKSHSPHKQGNNTPMTEMSIIDEHTRRHKNKHGKHREKHHHSKDRDKDRSRDRDDKLKQKKGKKHGHKASKEEAARAQAVYEKVIVETVRKTKRRRCCQLTVLLVVMTIILGLIVFLSFFFTQNKEDENTEVETTTNVNEAIS